MDRNFNPEKVPDESGSGGLLSSLFSAGLASSFLPFSAFFSLPLVCAAPFTSDPFGGFAGGVAGVAWGCATVALSESFFPVVELFFELCWGLSLWAKEAKELSAMMSAHEVTRRRVNTRGSPWRCIRRGQSYIR